MLKLSNFAHSLGFSFVSVNFIDTHVQIHIILVVISETHEFWKCLVKEASPQLNTETTLAFNGAAYRANRDKWEKIIAEQQPAGPQRDVPREKLDKWHYIIE